MTTSSGSKSPTKFRASAIPASTSSSRSRGGPGRLSSGLWDIQHRASVTWGFTPSRRQCEGVEELGAHVGRELSDAGARDAAIRAQEQRRFLMRVEPGFEATGAITHDDHIGILRSLSVRPVQLGQWPNRDKARAQGFPVREGLLAENLARVVVPAQYGEPRPQDVVQQNILPRPGVDARLHEQGA